MTLSSAAYCYSRQEEIQKNLDGMADRIQKYRVGMADDCTLPGRVVAIALVSNSSLELQDSRKLKEASLLDQLLLTPKQLRLKQYRETK